jgi:iron complex outermembrane recepter protein
MKRFFLCLVAVLATFQTVFSENKTTKDSLIERNLAEVFIVGNRAGSRTPVAQSNITAKDIQQLPLASNIPHVLWTTPSLVAFGENGTGSGNSYMRIRGVDASRINVTINGIPQNNPESQDMFWVDIPDLASGIQDLQIQRGVGTSTNGSAAFGGSINMTTRIPSTKPYVELTSTVGSYATFQENIAAGTGVFADSYSFDLRYSNLQSDGYIRNGWCDHASLFTTLAKRFERSTIRFNYIYGREKTGITWEGISQEQFEKNPKFNPAGAMSDSTWYKNESDNYWQHHFQVFYTSQISPSLLLNAGLNYTDGFGYYEQYKKDEELSALKISKQTVNDVPYDITDLIIRKNMDNGYYVGTLNFQYKKSALNLQGGGMYTLYDGDHFGELRWVEHNQNIPDNFEWVRNHARKTDANLFARVEYALSYRLNVWGDLQYRYVNYKLSGIDDDDMEDMTQKRKWNFLNPKAGVYFDIDASNKVYASVAIAHREPARADIKDSRKLNAQEDVKAERLTDVELGYRFDNSIWGLSVNWYGMFYKDQLVATGKLNDVGYALMNNVDKSYRTGIELQLGCKPVEWLQLDANTTFSQNIVQDYTAWFSTYNNSTDWVELKQDQLSQHFDEMVLPYSPEIIAALSLTVTPLHNLSVNATAKHVGSQYITNTQNEDLKLPAYQHINISANYEFSLFGKLATNFSLVCNNVFNKKYACNAWGYEAHFKNGDPTYVEKGLYVAAPRNYSAKFAVKF